MLALAMNSWICHVVNKAKYGRGRAQNYTCPVKKKAEGPAPWCSRSLRARGECVFSSPSLCPCQHFSSSLRAVEANEHTRGRGLLFSWGNRKYRPEIGAIGNSRKNFFLSSPSRSWNTFQNMRTVGWLRWNSFLYSAFFKNRKQICLHHRWKEWFLNWYFALFLHGETG